MRSSHSLDRLDTAFDDDRLVADAGLLLPATWLTIWACASWSTGILTSAPWRAGRTLATSF